MTRFGFPNADWKPWRLPDGLEVLVPGRFNTTIDENGDTLLYPQGDLSAPPSARMPKNGYFFDAIIRQPPIDEELLDPQDNLEDFTPISTAELDHFEREVKRAATTGRAVVATFAGLGDIYAVPSGSQSTPKGFATITEVVRFCPRRARYTIRCSPANARLRWAASLRSPRVSGTWSMWCISAGRTSARRVVNSAPRDVPRTLDAIPPAAHWLDPPRNTGWKVFKHSCGAVEKFIELPRVRLRHSLNPVQCSAAGMDPSA
jgi:hypothetical protein